MLDYIYRVSFIGHRQVEHFREVEEQLTEIVKDLIRSKEFVEFYIGRNGDFDILAASVIKRAQEKYGKANNSLILVIPYPITDMEYMEKYYDEIWYPDELHGVHYKSAITKRNEWFVDHSDLLVAYVTRASGGAYDCMKKAQQKGISVAQIGCVESK
ncbi:MAG: hypothetical protein E7680_03350 [Ruminococcaceae bacterium]|nr:hypothetical protein [Oscillospiraceae bacterium]